MSHHSQNLRSIYSFIFVALLYGCSGSTGGKSVVSKTFSDQAVSNFQQTKGLVTKNFFDKTRDLLIIPFAYAGDGEIKCNTDSAVSFDMDVFNQPITPIETTCSKNIELDIRIALLKSLIGKKLLMRYQGGNDGRSSGKILDLSDLTNEEEFWEIPHGPINGGDPKCFDQFTFNKETGKMTIELDVDSVHPQDKQYCLDFEFEGATEEDYKIDLAFRFKDGLLEYGPSIQALNEKGSDYSAFCISNTNMDDCEVIP